MNSVKEFHEMLNEIEKKHGEQLRILLEAVRELSSEISQMKQRNSDAIRKVDLEDERNGEMKEGKKVRIKEEITVEGNNEKQEIVDLEQQKSGRNGGMKEGQKVRIEEGNKEEPEKEKMRKRYRGKGAGVSKRRYYERKELERRNSSGGSWKRGDGTDGKGSGRGGGMGGMGDGSNMPIWVNW